LGEGIVIVIAFSEKVGELKPPVRSRIVNEVIVTGIVPMFNTVKVRFVG